ncbi:MAG TPA: isoprenylcysteine carboxylmethyltransferase family protein [Vicinamibacterales bacterium]|nr:isoprenylcysteine carboxylmethyltransferase family protein [Vicinamibacterales bacterium]
MIDSVPAYAYVLLAVGWVAWLLPFFVIARMSGPAATTDRRARWGMLLQAIGYSLLWQGPFWTRRPSAARFATSIALFAAAIALSWAGARAIGGQWRMDAGLNPDHELVRTGPYRIVRHPIYASMVAVFFATGAILTPPVLWIGASVVFIAGTEIRVRIEDRLLGAHFGSDFARYRHDVSAYVPFVR